MISRIYKKLRRIGCAAMRALKLWPEYLMGKPKTPRDVVYVIEDANWSIKWDGVYTTQKLNKLGRRASLDISTSFYKHKILHLGSSYVFETQAFKPFSDENKLIITFFHGKYGDEPQLDKRLDLLQENIDRIDGVVVSTSIMRDRFRDMGIPKDKIFLVPIGVNLQSFKPLGEKARLERRKELGIPEGAFVIGSFQKDGEGWGEGLEPKMIKGPDIFVEAVKKVVETQDVYVLLCGPARGYVKAGLEAAGIPYSAHYYDNPDDVVYLYQVLDAYAVTSREEGGPKAILESLACGIPLVTTDVGMARDVMEGHDCGYICPVEDVDAIAADLIEIAQNPCLRERLKVNSLKRIKDYSWAHVAEACEAMYREIEAE